MQWEMQQNENNKRKDYERAVDRAIDSMAIKDYQNYVEEQKMEPVRRAQRMAETQKMLDDCHGLRVQYLERERQVDRDIDAKQAQLRATGNAIDEQERRIRHESSLLNRDELQTQLQLEEEKRRREREQHIREGKEEYQMVMDEIARTQRQEADNRQALNEMQQTFQAMEQTRRQNQRFVEDRLDQGFAVKCINDDYRQFKRQQREERERRRIADLQARENMEIAERKYMKVDERAAKKAERERLLADYNAYLREEEEKAARQRYLEERNLAQLYNQDYQKFKRTRALEKEDVNYANTVKEKIAQDDRQIGEKLGQFADRVRELDSIKLLDESNKTLKKK